MLLVIARGNKPELLWSPARPVKHPRSPSYHPDRLIHPPPISIYVCHHPGLARGPGARANGQARARVSPVSAMLVESHYERALVSRHFQWHFYAHDHRHGRRLVLPTWACARGTSSRIQIDLTDSQPGKLLTRCLIPASAYCLGPDLPLRRQRQDMTALHVCRSGAPGQLMPIRSTSTQYQQAQIDPRRQTNYPIRK